MCVRQHNIIALDASRPAAGNPSSAMPSHSSSNPPVALHAGFCINAKRIQHAADMNSMDGTVSKARVDIMVEIYMSPRIYFCRHTIENMEAVLGMGMLGMASSISAAFVFLNKDTLFKKSETSASTATTTTTTTITTTPPAGSSSPTPVPRPGIVTDKRFSPYVLMTKTSTGLVGTKTKWTTLAFVVGYANSTIAWDAGAIDVKKLNAAISKVKGTGGGVIVSFGGASAGKKGSKYFAELAGKYTDPTKLADAYIAVATKLQSTWLDFDVEVDAVKDAASIDRRHKAIAILQQKRPDLRVSFTVPVETTGLDADTTSMLMKANAAGVRIDVVNVMAMYFTSSKTSMSTATAQAVTAARPFITGLGARIGITPQIGKNPSKQYAHEEFTLADAAAVVTSAKPETDVAVVSFWSLNNDTTKHKGAYVKTFSAFV